MLPASWLLFAATKNTGDLYGSFGFWFANFNLFDNGATGDPKRWHLYSLDVQLSPYAGCWRRAEYDHLGAGRFSRSRSIAAGRELIFSIILGGVLITGAVLALPLFLLLSKVGLTNTYWGVLLPSLVSPFGVYLSRVCCRVRAR